MDDIPGRSTDEHVLFTNEQLMTTMLHFRTKSLDDKYENLKEYLFETLACTEVQKKDIVRVLSTFKHQFSVRWSKAKRGLDRMKKNNAEWLKRSIAFPTLSHAHTTRERGRPALEFQESSDRTKRRKTASLRSDVPLCELVYATQMGLRSAQQPAAAAVLKEITTTTPKRALRYRQAFKAVEERKSSKLTSEQALSIFVEAKLTRKQYNLIREPAKGTYPSYKAIQQAKTECYPDNITVSEESAEVPVQDLLDHTTKRILYLQKEVLLSMNAGKRQQLTLICKWGCDGSAGHSEYKQKFSKGYGSDAYMFLTSLVPLQLISGTQNSKSSEVIWKKPRPSSPRFCRPIRLQQIHETKEITVAEMNHIQRQIDELHDTQYSLNDQIITVTHCLLFTMTDGKVCNAVTETSSTMKCYICGATSKDFNDIQQMISRPVDHNTFKFGLSTLHAWIRFFECLLHLAYKLPTKKCQSREDAVKKIVLENKKKIQDAFKSEMGLVVDKPKPGYGNTNDGNTARRFFQNTAVSSKITGIDEELISRCKIILETLSCGYEISTEKFKNYCHKTAQLYVNLYGWYNMPTTVHKILIHGAQVIASALLPIGQLSEEAQEARNKDIKKYREEFSRKMSSEQTMTDVFNLLLISSDPLISSARELPKKKISVLDKETLQLLEEPKIIIKKNLETSFTDEDSSNSDFEN